MHKIAALRHSKITTYMLPHANTHTHAHTGAVSFSTKLTIYTHTHTDTHRRQHRFLLNSQSSNLYTHFTNTLNWTCLEPRGKCTITSPILWKQYTSNYSTAQLLLRAKLVLLHNSFSLLSVIVYGHVVCNLIIKWQTSNATLDTNLCNFNV